MKIILFIFSLLISTQLPAQTPGLLWQKTIGCIDEESAYTAISTSDGNFVLAGIASDACSYTDTLVHARGDGWIIKMDTNGNKLWSRTFGGDSVDQIMGITQTTDGGYAMAGYTKSPLSNPNRSDYDYMIAKTDAEGNVLWQKNYGGSKIDQAFSIAETNDSGLIVVGWSMSSDGDGTGYIGGVTDLWVVKTDKLGNMIWQKCMGSTGTDNGRNIKKTSDGNFIITGGAGNADHDIHSVQGKGDVWVLKINGDGDILWGKTYGGTNTDGGEQVIQTKDNGYLIGAITYSNDGDISYNHGSEDLWAMKTDDTGKLIWQKTYGGSSDESLFGPIIESKEGGYFFCGNSSSTDDDALGNHGYSDFLIIKADDTGKVTWSHSYGGTSGESVAGAMQLPDSNYFVGGITNSANYDVTINYGPPDSWLLKVGKTPELAVANINQQSNEVLYPNITNDALNFRAPYDAYAKFTVNDMLGRKINIGSNYAGDHYCFDVSQLISGMYLLDVVGYTGYAHTYRFVIKR